MNQQWNHFSCRHIHNLTQRLQQTFHWRNPTQSRKNNQWTQAINQNKWRSKCLFTPHVRAQTHLQATLIKPIQSKKSCSLLESTVISKTNHMTMPRIVSDLTIPVEHHTTWKQYQNRKRIKRDIFSTLWHHTFEDSFLITYSFPFFAPLLT